MRQTDHQRDSRRHQAHLERRCPCRREDAREPRRVPARRCPSSGGDLGAGGGRSATSQWANRESAASPARPTRRRLRSLEVERDELRIFDEKFERNHLRPRPGTSVRSSQPHDDGLVVGDHRRRATTATKQRGDYRTNPAMRVAIAAHPLQTTSRETRGCGRCRCCRSGASVRRREPAADSFIGTSPADRPTRRAGRRERAASNTITAVMVAEPHYHRVVAREHRLVKNRLPTPGHEKIDSRMMLPLISVGSSSPMRVSIGIRVLRNTCVIDDDACFVEPLGARGANVILADHFQRRAARGSARGTRAIRSVRQNDGQNHVQRTRSHQIARRNPSVCGRRSTPCR